MHLLSIYQMFVAAGLLLFTSSLGAGEIVVDDTRGFTLTLPDGFVSNPGLLSAAPDVVHAFILGDPSDDQPDIALLIQSMPGTIGRERLGAGSIPADSQSRLSTMKWQDYDVEVFEVPEKFGDVSTLTFNVQIPLKRAAIQVKLIGFADRESELNSLLEQTLTGLKGESNWMQSAVPTSAVASSESYGGVLLAFAIVFILVGLLVLYFISRIASKGAVLAIAAVLYGASFAIPDMRIREVVMFTGALRLLGVLGGIVGIIVYFRKCKPPVGNAT